MISWSVVSVACYLIALVFGICAFRYVSLISWLCLLMIFLHIFVNWYRYIRQGSMKPACPNFIAIPHPVCAPTPVHVQVQVHCIGWEDCVCDHFQLPRRVGSRTPSSLEGINRSDIGFVGQVAGWRWPKACRAAPTIRSCSAIAACKTGAARPTGSRNNR